MTTPSTLPIDPYPLDPPPLEIFLPALQAGFSKNFSQATISIVPCPDLTLPPYHLSSPGLSGNESIVDIGGPAYLHPFPNFSKKYDFESIIAQISAHEEKRCSSETKNHDGQEGQDGGEGDKGKRGKEDRFAIGAAAGPFHLIGQNSELTPNLTITSSGPIKNLTTYTLISPLSSPVPSLQTCLSSPVPNASTSFALMANIFLSSGLPGPVMHIRASSRTGPLNFTNCIQASLRAGFGDKVVSLGGVFVVRKGRVKCHVMPDFSKEALEGEEDVKRWLRFFEWEGRGLVFCGVLHSMDPGLGLRGEHTHCVEVEGEGETSRGGHYHGDLDETREVVEYEGYFNVARWIYRVDRPPGV